jgi:sugar O-acyltransferase (sialic acid O-acetyltransferase NeuD family)
MKPLPVIVLGTGGHARVLIDALLLSPVNLLGTTDTNHQNQSLLGVPYLGGDEVIEKYSSNEICLVNGIGSISQPYLRRTIFKKFKNLGYRFINVIHPSSIIATDVKLGEGVQVMAGAIIQSGSEIGDNSIINTRTSVDHDCRIGQHIHLAPGAILCGNVCIEDLGHVGAGAIILQSIRVGAQVLVDAGTLVKSDIEGIARDKGIIA